jgi:hypothetical protein
VLLLPVLLLSFTIRAYSQSANNLLLKDSLQADYRLLNEVLHAYHPGLYRYQDSATIEQHFQRLQQDLDHDQTLKEAYLALSRFTAKLRCGHTFCSYFNQPKAIRDSLFNKNDKLPFTTVVHNRKIIILHDFRSGDLLPSYTEITSVNGTSSGLIIDTLLQYLKGDGNNDAKRLYDLSVTGEGKAEAFDVYFPLLFPPENGQYRIRIKSPGKETEDSLTVNTISRETRREIMNSRNIKIAEKVEDTWNFQLLPNSSARLTIGSFVVYNTDWKWKNYLQQCFDTIRTAQVRHLIIDIRGNEGGSDEVYEYILKHLASKDLSMPGFTSKTAYEKVVDEHRSYLDTWDNSFYNRKGTVLPDGKGMYELKSKKGKQIIKAHKNAYTGEVYLLTDAGNSSATFLLALILKHNQRAKLIGDTTGGNLKGTNGGQLFFFRLPYSRIEIDLPLIGYYPEKAAEDAGLSPDILSVPGVEDWVVGKDKTLQTVLRIIARNP